MTDTFRTPVHVDATHPALAGHFPGHPVVPGVVLLERVAAAWKGWTGASVGRLDAKFLRPLAPDEDAVIALHGDASRVRFEVVQADGNALARGTLESAPSR